MPAVELLSADGRADADAFSKTFIEAHAGADARAFPKPDDGDARAHASTICKSDARALLATDDGRALLKTDAVALLV